MRPGLSAGIIDAGLSRGLAGISGSTLVVNIAGSRLAVRDGMATLNPLAAHIIGQLVQPRDLIALDPPRRCDAARISGADVLRNCRKLGSHEMLC